MIGARLQRKREFLPGLVLIVQAELAKANKIVSVSHLRALARSAVGPDRHISIGRSAQFLGACIDELPKDRSGAIRLSKLLKRQCLIVERGLLNRSEERRVGKEGRSRW